MYIIVNQEKISIYKNLYTVYNIILDYIDIIINCNNSLYYLDNLKIYHIKKNIIIDIYTIDKKFNLLNSNNNIININNNFLNSYRLKLLNKDNLLSNHNKIQESEINTFLPLYENNIVSESYDDINTNIYIKPKNINKEEIIFLINNLKNKIEDEKIKLENINKKYENKLDSYLESKHKLGLLEIREKQKLEKEEENRKVFKVDKKIYNIFKQEINDNIRDPDDIPEIFINKYLIFKKLDEINNNSIYKSYNDDHNINSGILDDSPLYSEEYNEFKKLKNQLNVNFNISSTFDNMFDDDNNVYNKLSNNLKWESEIDSQSDSSEEYTCSSVSFEGNNEI